MKTLLTLCIISLSSLLQAQVLAVNETYNPSSSTDEIYIDSEYGSMEIVMASVNEIKIEGTVMINMGNGNEAYSISGKQQGNTFIINTELEEDGLEEMMILRKKDGTKKIIIKEKGKSIQGRLSPEEI